MQQHCEPEDMALLALGEQNQPCQEHVLSCPQCRQEFDQLCEVVTLGRASGGPDSLVEPSPELWERISSQLDTEPVALHTDVKALAEPSPSGS